MSAYYNELDPYAAQWLRNLIAKGLIADGVVDNRSIVEVTSDDLKAFTQVHFFAGIGVWSHALRLAGWPDTRPVWTGSCPCQPFSVAGKGTGFADERHLWPEFFRLICECRPSVVFGEQVASKDGLSWLDTVYADLEGEDYATAAVDICAAGVGAPHIRQRLYFVADDTRSRRGEEFSNTRRSVEGAGERQAVLRSGYSDVGELADPQYHKQRGGRGTGRKGQEGHESRVEPSRCGSPCELGDDDHKRLEGYGSGYQATGRRDGAFRPVAKAGESRGLADSAHKQYDWAGNGGQTRRAQYPDSGATGNAGPTNGHWRDADWLYCRDAKWRPVEPGTFPLAHGASARVGRLRAYGNAIVPQVAQAVIESYMEARP